MNGNDIMTGGSIIIPIPINTLETTISMIKNGMKIIKPIWKAVFSSLIANAGIITDNGISS
ncbi:hypothetical protein D3C80_2163000 [compost metagenome]